MHAQRTHPGIGRYVPPKVVTNDDLTALMDTTDEWIQQRTGIRERHYSEGRRRRRRHGRARGARGAGARRRRAPSDVDCVIFATLSPDVDMPASACVLQAHLGIGGMPAFDVRNQCSGFLYGAGDRRRVHQDRPLRARAGGRRRGALDGHRPHHARPRRGGDLRRRRRRRSSSGPSRRPAQRGILSTHLHAEGKYAEKLWLECAGRARAAAPDRGDDRRATTRALFPRMEGRYVFKHAVTRFPEVIHEALAANGYTPRRPRPASFRTRPTCASARWWRSASSCRRRRSSTTSSATATPPRRRSRSPSTKRSRTGACATGDLLCLAAFGAGFTWASALIRW